MRGGRHSAQHLSDTTVDECRKVTLSSGTVRRLRGWRPHSGCEDGVAVRASAERNVRTKTCRGTRRTSPTKEGTAMEWQNARIRAAQHGTETTQHGA
eukprot:gene20169-biopygen23542